MLNILIQTLGGLGIFILGMKLMTEGLQMAAGNRIRNVLKAVSDNRVVGFATGAAVTALVQSSSATTVMLISFVSAGLMSLTQAVGVMLGCNVGTTMTAQLIAFKLSALALPAIALGVPLKYFSTRKKYRYLGEVILGFGLLFFGMTVMGDGLKPLRLEPEFIAFFTKFNAASFGGILLCVATGCGLTMILQSSSATVGLTMALATQGLLDFPSAMALVLGENIGTTITAELATIGSTSIDAHRAARSNTMFNVLGVCIMLLIFPWFLQGIEWATASMGVPPWDMHVGQEYPHIGRYLANGHTLFNLTNAFVFLVFLPVLVRVGTWLSPKDKTTGDSLFRQPVFDQHVEDNPVAALAQVRGEIHRMSLTVQAAYSNALECLETRDHRTIRQRQRFEDQVNAMHRAISTFLAKTMQSEINEETSNDIAEQMRVVNNLERIGDAVEAFGLLCEDIVDKELKFNEVAMRDLFIIAAKVDEFLKMISDALIRQPEHLMEKAEEAERTIDAMRESMREAHIERLKIGKCGIEGGLTFINLLARLEKIGDYCYSIARSVTSEH
ncbi:Na/Pi cotransporter family protein [Desulfomicrobium baculatum]|uniref:Na/Pi-cotransporter II-related protein n=1 Tax=Desulfomicrobium baculatum (strain DSM 4028 / VKM B-1378 / X) TaxID=525897 RepID=C7LTQ5_DESBD|nr:Na/Pi cotransporter family protein [Desulfomicrobium baculatum]ACU88340.1 Na/Pi-cotransporter II-related protein [Desulfomicrobium baculatum DSM 4028]